MHQQHIAVKLPVRPFVKGYYSDIASIPKIGTAGFALLTVLFNHRVKTNLAWPSQERLSELTGLCRNSIAKHVGTLVNEGNIELGKSHSSRNGLPHNTYTLNEPSGYWVPLHANIISLIPELGHIGFGIYSLIARYADRSSFIAYPSDDKLTAELGICERTLKTHLTRVIDCGLVQPSTLDWHGSEIEVYEVTGLQNALERNEHPSEPNEHNLELESPSKRALSKSISESTESGVPTPRTHARQAQDPGSNKTDQNASISTTSMAAPTQWTELELDLADLETERSAALVTSSRAASKPGTDSELEPEIPERDSDPDQTIHLVLSAPRIKQIAVMSATARALATVADDDVDELDFLPTMDPWDGWEDDTSTESSVVPGTTNPVIFQSSSIVNLPQDAGSSATTEDWLQSGTGGEEKTVGHEGKRPENQPIHPLETDLLMTEARAWWDDLSETLQTQVRTAIINREATCDPIGAAYMLTPAILSRVCEIGFTATFRLVSADPDATPVVRSAFDETPDDIRARIRQRRIDLAAATAVYAADLKAAAERITAVDHDVLDGNPDAAAVVAYQLPSGDTFVVAITNAGYGWSRVVKKKDVVNLPFNLVPENEPGGTVDAVFIRQVAAQPTVFSVSSEPLPEPPVSSFVAVGDVLRDSDGGIKSDANPAPAPPSGVCARLGNASRCQPGAHRHCQHGGRARWREGCGLAYTPRHPCRD